ncbi:MAG: ATP-binding protein [Myxococcota bacterium]|jgi:signal transduction histidine kinase|nr:ATP-binding protein [Myxococcota bacterium]
MDRALPADATSFDTSAGTTSAGTTSSDTTNVDRAEIHAALLAPFAEEAAKVVSPAAMAEIFRKANVAPSALADKSAWVSLETLESFVRETQAAVDDPTFLSRASRLSFTEKYLGPLRTVLRAIGSPRAVYEQTPGIISRFNKVGDFQLESVRRGEVVLVYRPLPGARIETEPLICRGRSENLAAVPTVFDLAPATIEHDRCLHRGDDACVYRIHYTEPSSKWRSRLAFVLGIAAGIGLSIYLGAAWWLCVGFVLVLAIAFHGAARTVELREELAQSASVVTEQQDALVRSTIANEERFAELLEAKTAVDRQVEERTAELSATSARLAETLDQVQALDRAKTDFFANVSHDLRTPLTLILSPLESLRRGETPPGGEQAAFESMHLASRRLLGLIDRLLDLAKADAGRERLELRSTSLRSLLGALHKSFAPAALSRGVELSIDTDVEVPVELDLRWVDSALSNLVANAMRFARTRIAIRARDLGGEIVLEVEDDGPGIPPADRAVIFERFGQASAETRKRSGTGLGLAIVREAARLHGGQASVEESSLSGARFVLRLPRRVATHAPEAITAAATTSEVTTDATTAPSPLATPVVPADLEGPDALAPLVLVAEDNPELRRFLGQVLATRFRVRAVVDGEEALAAAAAEPPDLVVTDVSMPRIDGIELVRRLRATPATREIPILVVTARGEPSEVLDGFDAGADDYLLKPFHGRELLARIDVQLRLRTLARELAHRERLATLGTLASSVAHHVRNPLTALVSGLPAMRRRLADQVDPRSREMLDVFVDCAHRIERITLDLLDLSRVDRQEFAPFRPSEGLAAAVRLLSARVPAGLVFETDIEESPLVEGRPADLNHAFLNLIDNAARAIGDDGALRVSGRVDAGQYVVSVEDSGSGVPPELREKIFERFVTTRRHGEGAGIGLAIARDVARSHGGDISVDRSPTLGGARFVLRLPLPADRREVSPGALLQTR